MSWGVEFSVTEKEWMKNPKQRFNNALRYTGIAWRSANKHYPTRTGGVRTGALGSTATFQIVVEGEEIEYLAKFYWKYLMYGTGIYGPKGSPIVPVRARILAWRGSGGWVFAQSVRGSKWQGRLDQIKRILISAYKAGIASETMLTSEPGDV